MKIASRLCVIAMGLAICFAGEVRGQYNQDLPAKNSLEAGIRIGGTSGVTGKYFYRQNMAVEGIVGTFGNGFSISALLEKHLPIYGAEGLFVYYGGGAHLAFYNGRSDVYSNFGRDVDYRKSNDAGLGIDGIIGLEYRLPNDIPIGFSLDLKPFVEIGTGGYVAVAPDPSIGIKFIIR